MSLPPANPYRQILRRRLPNWIPLLLAALLGIWLARQYFGGLEGYPPGTEQMALLKIDRDLRLAEAMQDDPRWLRWLVRVERPEDVRTMAVETLKRLEKVQREAAVSNPALREVPPLSAEARQALEVLRADERGLALLQRLAARDRALVTSELELRVRLALGEGRWWEATLLRGYRDARGTTADAEALAGFDAETRKLRERALAARGTAAAVMLLGIVFLPWALGCLAKAATARAKGYASAWTATLGWTVFLAATLAWLGFGTVIGIGLLEVTTLPPEFAVFLETAVRMLPALIAIGFLFRRPRHAARVFGLNRGPVWPLVFGVLSALLLFDGAVSRTFAHWVRSDPTGGLNGADAGDAGLLFILLSACLLAPVAEEILYRGVLFRSLANRFGTLPGAVFSAAVFAALHFYNPYGLATVGLLGLACALVFAATRRLSTAVALHVLYNVAVKVPEWIVYHATLTP